MREIIWFDAYITFAKESVECFVSREMLKFVIWEFGIPLLLTMLYLMLRLPVI